MLSGALDIALWLILASLVVLIIMNPKGFTQDVGQIGTTTAQESSILTGSGYKQNKGMV